MTGRHVLVVVPDFDMTH